MTSVFVATPMYGGMCTGPYAFSLFGLRDVLGERNIPMHYSFVMNEALIQRARNNLVHSFLRSGCTHMLFIDADIKFDGNDVLKMLDADKDIICGIYPLKYIDWARVHQAAKNGVPPDQLRYHSTKLVANLLSNQSFVNVLENEPFEVLDSGTGFMLIKRRVFEELLPVVPTYIHASIDVAGSIEPDATVHEFFAASIDPDHNILLSEDYHFCRLWRQHGGSIHVAPWVRLGHIGTYQFDG
jgi:hypothetical protein